MKKEIILVGVVLLLVFASGCGLTETKYVCPDGTIVTRLDECEGQETPVEEEEEEEEEEPSVPVEPETPVEEEEEEEEEETDEKVITKITANEGELVSLKPQARDPDEDDEITYTFSDPFNSDGEWQTERGDAGTYEITVTASDGTLRDSRKVLVIVESVNRPPVLQRIPNVTVREGETVRLSPVATDPDGDAVTITYSGWMDKATYTTTYEDAGTHTVTVRASDGIDSVSQDVTINVLKVNRPPEIIGITAETS